MDSTQSYLASSAEHHHEGDLVISEVQTAGRGRGEERKWISPPGGLWLSIFLEPSPTALNLISGMATQTVLETLNSDYSLTGLQVKPPNDILCGTRKIAGVLVDASIKGSSAVAILGIGVNLNNRIRDEKEISETATSYFEETGCTVSLEDFAFRMLVRLDTNYARLETNLWKEP